MAFGDRLGGEGPAGHGCILVSWDRSSLSLGDHGVEHGTGDGPLVGQGDLGASVPAAVTMMTALVSCSKPTSGADDVVGHDEVGALALELAGGVGDDVVGLGGEADEHLARALAGAQRGQDVGGGLEHDVGDAVVPS